MLWKERSTWLQCSLNFLPIWTCSENIIRKINNQYPSLAFTNILLLLLWNLEKSLYFIESAKLFVLSPKNVFVFSSIIEIVNNHMLKWGTVCQIVRLLTSLWSRTYNFGDLFCMLILPSVNSDYNSKYGVRFFGQRFFLMFT